MRLLKEARALWRSDGPGGTVARRLLPTVILGLFVLSSFRWLGEHNGLYGSTTGLLMTVLAVTAFIVALILHFAVGLDRIAAAQREVEAELKRSSRYFDLSRDLACTAGMDGIFIQLNAAWTQTLGWSEDELRSRPFVEFVHPDDRERTVRETAALAQGDGTVKFVNRCATKDGGWRWLDWCAVAVLDEGVIYASAREVTDRKEAEFALAASRERLQAVIDHAPDAFVSMDSDGLITEWNREAQRMFGWKREEARGKRVSELIIPPELRDAHELGLTRYLSTRRSGMLNRPVEVAAVTKSAHMLAVELTIAATGDGTAVCFNAFLRDISERKAAEEQLERHRRQLEEAQTVGGFGSWERDLLTDEAVWSAQMFRLLGVEPRDEAMTLEELMTFVHPDDRDALNAAWQSTGSVSVEHRIRRADGAERVLHVRGEVTLDEDGTPLRRLGIQQDITERRVAERAKEEFTSVVSHELRTPLTSIRGSLGLLESGVLGPLPEKGQRMIEIAVENTDRLVRLINDILDIERINSGTIDMQQRPCDAAELIERAVDGVRQFAADADVTLATDAAPVTLPADPDRILQALTNLISNAVKFSPKGGTVRLSSQRTENGVRFDVRDEGRGIPADKLESIFERFQQVDASDSREKGGTGLGLAICRTIVERHGGHIWVDSEPGVGSTFSFMLPAWRAAGTPSPDAVASGPTILVCDDDSAVVEVVTAMLQHRGFNVVGAHSGDEALALATAERPEAIVLDLLMPGLGGRETAAALARQPETSDIPVLILSVLSEAEAGLDGEQFSAWITKPMDEASLFAALERAIGSCREDHVKVLVVEDDGDLAEILIASLTSRGVETFHAADGHAAIQLSQRVLPDLMVLDLGLPEADGYAVVDWLRRHKQLRRMALVVYTGRHLDPADRDRLRLDGATEFLTKAEVSPAEFEQHVMRRLAALERERFAKPVALPVS